VGVRSTALADELRTLEAARAALLSGDARSALRQLDEHDRTYAAGVFAEEGRVLRIDALLRAGNRPAAEALARAFLAKHPTSAHAPRLRAMVGEGSSTP
jgi:outer membrane protein assembly factor BamD (BamD/ComL family)